MSFFISQNHQNHFSIFKILVHREYNDVSCIINKNKRKKIDKSDFKSIYDFLLNEISHEKNILFQKRINELNDKNEIDNKNLIKFANINKLQTSTTF